MADASAVERAYRTHGPMVLRRARQILGSEDDSREVLHELFVSLLGNPSELTKAESLAGWFYGATTHRCLNRLRDARHRARLLETNALAEPRETKGSAELDVSVRRFLSDLPDELGRAAVYYYLDEMTHEEISKILCCSRRHVGDLLEEVKSRAEKRRIL